MRARTERDRVAESVEPVRVAPSRTERSVLRLVWIVVALITLALFKPWGTGSKAPPGGAFVPATTYQPASPTPRPSTPLDAVASFCLEPSGWRVYSVEHFADQRVRSWTAVTPATSATGPTDPRIPVIPVVSQAVLALGFCSPVFEPDRPPADAIARLYRLASVTIGGQKVVRAAPITPPRIEPPGDASALGAVYAPVGGTSWTDGVYIVQIDGSEYTRWFGIQVEILRRTTPN
jgi:hypothetical protein